MDMAEMDPRTEAKLVRDYLDLLTAPPKPQGRRTTKWMRKRLGEIQNSLDNPSELGAMRRVELIQERIDLERDLAEAEDSTTLDEAEAAFIQVGKHWAERKGISRKALREIGVPADVLKRAGI